MPAPCITEKNIHKKNILTQSEINYEIIYFVKC